MFKNTIRLLATVKYRAVFSFIEIATDAQRSPSPTHPRSIWRFSHKFVCFLCHWFTLQDFAYLEVGARSENTLPLDEIEMPKATLYNALWLWFSLLLLHQYLFIIVPTIWRERSCVNSNSTTGEIPKNSRQKENSNNKKGEEKMIPSAFLRFTFTLILRVEYTHSLTHEWIK